MRVLKFGGTSVADAGCFKKVAAIVLAAAAKEQVAVVLSAPAKITNLLVALVQAGASGSDCSEELASVRSIVNPIIENLAAGYSDFDRKSVQLQFNGAMEQIQRRITGMIMLGECPDSVKAFVESRGESFSIAIMSALLKAMGRKVRILDPVAVLVAEGSVMEASVNIEASKERYAALDPVESDAITLMSGFCGGSPCGQLVLLGRNGSDYSAACLAAVCGASCCEIWTDVDGVYSCDPRAVPDSLLLKKMSYKEAMELSYFGAKVLHPRTITPIARYHIPCLIKNTAHPEGEGTLISEAIDQSVPIKGISDLKNISLINVSGPGMKGMVGMAGRLFTAVSRAGVSIILITQSSSEYSISFCISTSELQKAKDVISEEFKLELKAGLLDPVEVIDKCAIISVVGDGMRTMCGTSGRFFRALAEASVNVSAIAQGSSERSISAVISEDKVSAAVSVCHMAFFNSRRIMELIIVGVGGVGSELVNQIRMQKEILRRDQGVELKVVGVADIDHFLGCHSGVDLDHYREQMNDPKNPRFSMETLDQFLQGSNFINPILVDCTSDNNIALSYGEYMRRGLHVVTPNKKANTGSYDYYRELRECSRHYHRKFFYEANVGAGLPVINTLQKELAAGDSLIEFEGIMSGTLSYIFGLVEDGYTLSEATANAYSKGFTEPNPRDDLEGCDVARKLLILARECGYPLELTDVAVEPAVPPEFLRGANAQEVLQNLKAADAEFSRKVWEAKSAGKVLRYVGTIKGEKCACGVMAVDAASPLFKVRGGENAMSFTTAYYRPIPMVIRGYGAGTSVTAAGVLADILRLQSWTREV